jgi:hypothetical protein
VLQRGLGAKQSGPAQPSLAGWWLAWARGLSQAQTRAVSAAMLH